MNNERNESKQSDGYTKFFDACVGISIRFFKLLYSGAKTGYYKERVNYILMLSIITLLAVLIYKDKHYALINLVPFNFLQPPLIRLFDQTPFHVMASLSTLLVIIVATAIAGLRPYMQHNKYQQAVDHLGFKTGLGDQPKVVNVETVDGNRTKILVKSSGIGEDKFKSKLDDLRSASGQRVESVDYWDKDNRYLEISLSNKTLESQISYATISSHARAPYSFVVGKALNKVVVESLESVPHYLIAGSTGGGKSMAFKSMLLGLLESSAKIQMYLFDFKQVEMKDFQDLPNVKIIKEEYTASMVLESLVREMNKRYTYLERKGYKSINPERDKMDRIIVGIDECADLLGKNDKYGHDHDAMERAKSYLVELARKARASGIHLIFATQKVDKTVIDTQIQENLEGRLSFRMNTVENSVRILQNNMSYNLPSIAGRAIWKRGANYFEVQCPYLSDSELRQRLQVQKDQREDQEVTMISAVDGKKQINAARIFTRGETFRPKQ